MTGKISMPVFTLCDSATVREGLLHILGAGVTAIQREDGYPSRLDAVLAAIVHISGERTNVPRLKLRITTSDGDPIGIDELALGPGADEQYSVEDDSIYTIPIIVDASNMMIPAPGRYRFTFSDDTGEQYSAIEFEAS